jgi:hypothetical protein
MKNPPSPPFPKGGFKVPYLLKGDLYQVAIKQVAQASRLCKRRLKPAATKNISLIATGY